jgi:hypothetical protein
LAGREAGYAPPSSAPAGSHATKQLARIAGTPPNPVVSFRFFRKLNALSTDLSTGAVDNDEPTHPSNHVYEKAKRRI